MLFTESAAYGQFYGGSGAHLAGFGDYIRGSLLELWWSRLMVGHLWRIQRPGDAEAYDTVSQRPTVNPLRFQ
jgi:hypothetical protein